MSGRRPLWSQLETDFLIKRAHDGVTDQVIATELEYLEGAKPHDPKQVGLERERLGLPPADALTSMRSVLTNDAAIPLAIRTKGASRLPLARTVNNDSFAHVAPVKQEFEPAAEAIVQAEPARVLKIETAVESLSSCEKGDIVVIAGIGPAQCIDVKKGSYAGIDMKHAVVREMYPLSNPLTKRLDLEKFPDNVRKPVSADVMSQILDKLENGLSDDRASVSNGEKLSVRYMRMCHSADINDVANVLCLVQGRSRTSTREYSSMEITYADQAKRLIAAELSLVRGTQFDEALRLINERLEKGKAKDLALAAVAKAALLISPEAP